MLKNSKRLESIKAAHKTKKTSSTTNSKWWVNDIDLPKAHQLTRGNPDIIVAVLDTGVDYLHKDLAENISIFIGFKKGWLPHNFASKNLTVRKNSQI